LNFSLFPCAEGRIISEALYHFPLTKMAVEASSLSGFLPVAVCLPRAREEKEADIFSERLI